MPGQKLQLILGGFILAVIFFTAPPANAGFEWIPPSEIQQNTAPDFPIPMSPDMPPAGGAAAIMPAHNAMPVDITAPAQRQNGFYINPYPQGQPASPGDSMMGTGPVEQAMMEVSQDLNPAPLGHGFTTAPKPRPPKRRMSAARPVTQAVKQNIPMTPLPVQEIEPVAPIPNEQPPAPVLPVRDMPVPQAYQPMIDPDPVPSAYSGSMYPDVQGFGRDLPLALALTQIIPPQYALSFETGVNPGATVSWEGGRPWDQVLSDMLSQAGLSANIQGKVIRVYGA